MSDPMMGMVRGAFDAVVADRVKRTPMLPPLTDEEQQRLVELQQQENDRRCGVMRDHQLYPGTRDVCMCGEVCMSTPGYLLHLYEVVEDDLKERWGL